MGQMTTGASNDFERATEMARRMVTQWGMSDIAWARWSTARTRARCSSAARSPRTRTCPKRPCSKVDAEIRRIIDQQYALARKLIEENRDKVEAMAKALLEWETIDADQIDDIMEGRPPRPPKPAAANRCRHRRTARRVRQPRPTGADECLTADGEARGLNSGRQGLHPSPAS
jgi:cell division protease FtsH